MQQLFCGTRPPGGCWTNWSRTLSRSHSFSSHTAETFFCPCLVTALGLSFRRRRPMVQCQVMMILGFSLLLLYFNLFYCKWNIYLAPIVEHNESVALSMLAYVTVNRTMCQELGVTSGGPRHMHGTHAHMWNPCTCAGLMHMCGAHAHAWNPINGLPSVVQFYLFKQC